MMICMAVVGAARHEQLLAPGLTCTRTESGSGEGAGKIIATEYYCGDKYILC